MYGSSAFYEKLTRKRILNSIEKVERRCNIIMARSYQDINHGVSCILAGSPPFHLQITHRSIQWLLTNNYPVSHWGHLPPVEYETGHSPTMNGSPTTEAEIKKIWQKNTLEVWNKEWENNPKGMWTHQLFPTIQTRLQITDPPDFWTSQAITGHGVFGAYLHSRKRRCTQICNCGAPEETPQHIYQECILFSHKRPSNWEQTTTEHVKYMRETALELWMIENPNFRHRKSPRE